MTTLKELIDARYNLKPEDTYEGFYKVLKGLIDDRLELVGIAIEQNDDGKFLAKNTGKYSDEKLIKLAQYDGWNPFCEQVFAFVNGYLHMEDYDYDQCEEPLLVGRELIAESSPDELYFTLSDTFYFLHEHWRYHYDSETVEPKIVDTNGIPLLLKPYYEGGYAVEVQSILDGFDETRSTWEAWAKHPKREWIPQEEFVEFVQHLSETNSKAREFWTHGSLNLKMSRK